MDEERETHAVPLDLDEFHLDLSEPHEGSSRCPICGRYAALISPPNQDQTGEWTWRVRCAKHGDVWDG